MSSSGSWPAHQGKCHSHTLHCFGLKSSIQNVSLCHSPPNGMKGVRKENFKQAPYRWQRLSTCCRSTEQTFCKAIKQVHCSRLDDLNGRDGHDDGACDHSHSLEPGTPYRVARVCAAHVLLGNRDDHLQSAAPSYPQHYTQLAYLISSPSGLVMRPGHASAMPGFTANSTAERETAVLQSFCSKLWAPRKVQQAKYSSSGTQSISLYLAGDVNK